MKTAMQIFWDYIDANYHEDNFNIQNVRDKSLEDEKSQIIYTYWEAYKEGQYSGDRTADEYYEQTFNPQDDNYSHLEDGNYIGGLTMPKKDK
jgi:hypothetical protein